MVIDRAERLFGLNPIRFVPGLWRAAVLHTEDRRFRVLVREGLDSDGMRTAITTICDDFESDRWSLPASTATWSAGGGWRPAGLWLARAELAAAPLQAEASARWTPVPPSR